MKTISKRIFRKIRNANIKYNLIENNDRIAVAMSGGKDSLTLLYFLDLLKKYTPLDFEIVPIYLDLGWNNDITSLTGFCNNLNIPLIIEPTNIGKIVFEIRNEKNPCSLCANLRRGAIHRVAKHNGCAKLALGHHMNDAVSTLFLSILYEGRFHLFKPAVYLDRSDITLIRPLVYVAEAEIRNFISILQLTPVKNLCPADGMTKRTEINELIEILEEKHPKFAEKFLKSLENVDSDSFWS